MREADRLTIEEIGVPSMVLMENAGRQVVVALEGRFSDLTERRVAMLCGRGNNGGDGFVVARTLKQRGVEATVFVIGTISDIEGDARRNLEILGRIGMPVVEIADEQSWELHYSEICGFDIIVDAILGTGVKLPLVGLLQTLAADINGLAIPVVSVDLPTGLSADSHDVTGEAIEATLTVTMGAPKLPLVLPPAEIYGGDLVVAD
ncbi:MAG: NAD(P)H-hydrate epimerase, partial [Vicinamibacterales bacterium]|nr:NAD(P)H-hydrate epimerase [Vicinamibacterales bacterium]